MCGYTYTSIYERLILCGAALADKKGINTFIEQFTLRLNAAARFSVIIAVSRCVSNAGIPASAGSNEREDVLLSHSGRGQRGSIERKTTKTQQQRKHNYWYSNRLWEEN